jgi:hypothetical protein
VTIPFDIQRGSQALQFVQRIGTRASLADYLGAALLEMTVIVQVGKSISSPEQCGTSWAYFAEYRFLQDVS